MRKYEAYFAELVKLCRDNETELFVFIWPVFHRFNNYPYQDQLQKVEMIISKYHCTYVEVLEEFEHYSSNPYDFRVDKWFDHHPNAFAHSIIANRFIDQLRQTLARKQY